MKPLFLLDHPLFRAHDTGPGHPERAERLEAIGRGIRRRGLESQLEWVEPSPVAREHLLRVHTERHVMKMLSLIGQYVEIDADTQVSPSSIEAALVASGAAVKAVDLVLGQTGSSAFCLCRPPGHHAERDRAMGFCLFNHVAVAAAYAISEKGISRVLIIDPDVHHGNGTQDIFYERGDVGYLSIHQWPLFPGTGRANETGSGDGKGHTLNVPLPAGAGDPEYLEIARRVVLPMVRSFAPGLVIFSAGFDAHQLDPLGGMQLTSGGFAKFYEIILRELVARGIPSLFSLEGGYSLQALEESVPDLLETILEIA